MKYLILFEKGEPVRWLGHLDILRTFERAIRRAELPIAFTAGFNPREKLAFASALSVGVTGAEEPATVELTEPLDGSEVVERLNANLPPGIRLLCARPIADAGSRDLLNSYHTAELEVTCDCAEASTNDLMLRITSDLLKQEKLVVQRQREGRAKEVDIRPLIRDIFVRGPEERRITFIMLMALGGEGTAKPAEVIDLVAERAPGLSIRRIRRVRLLSDDPIAAGTEGSMAPKDA
jgi:radical SAM-linked protein